MYIFDYDIVDKGFLIGWLGVFLFMLCLYRVINNEKWLYFFCKMLNKELEKILFDDIGLF